MNITVYAYNPLSQSITRDGADTGFVLSKDRGIAGGYHVLKGTAPDSPMLEDQGYGFASVGMALEAFRAFDEHGQPSNWLIEAA